MRIYLQQEDYDPRSLAIPNFPQYYLMLLQPSLAEVLNEIVANLPAFAY